MSKIKNSILELIGNTPLVRLRSYSKISKLRVDLVAKLEMLNPIGSIKDRIALAMIREAEKNGTLKKGSIIIEPTSGNTGIALAAIGAVLGYKVILTMPSTMSQERRELLKAYGATIVLTDGERGMSGAIEKAFELKDSTPNSCILGQFTNAANPLCHYNTTAAEIYKETNGDVDIIVAGVGTGGTISGVASFLKHIKPSIRVVAVEPTNSAVLSGGEAGAHRIQGIGAGFIPQTLNPSLIDEIVKVTDDEAFDCARTLALSEGILAGISSGAALYAATTIAKKSEYALKKIIVILPDTGERYLSILNKQD